MGATGLRVTGGRLGGRRLRAPTRGARPTSDRVREALFARLGDLRGTTVLDLYAGSGVLGVEAASRGAGCIVFVERAAGCLATLRANLRAVGLDDSCRVLRADVPDAVRRLGRLGARFDLVLLDPPSGPLLNDRYRGAEFYCEGKKIYLYSSGSSNPRLIVYATADAPPRSNAKDGSESK